MTATLETDLVIGPNSIHNFSRLPYTIWFALAEFVDNSTQSRINYAERLDPVLRSEGRPLTVSIVHSRQAKEITVEDNSIGMSKDDLIAALHISLPTPDSVGRSRYGMGMKTAACWLGRQWKVITCELGSGEEWTAEVDVDAIANQRARVPLTLRQVEASCHYTKVVIGDLRRVIQKRSEETILAYLGSMYRFDLRKETHGHPALRLTYNGQEVATPEESEWDTDPDGHEMFRELPPLVIESKVVRGKVGILKKGGRKLGGFSMFQNNRQIHGIPNAWKPRAIFGGADDEGANNLVSQRLTGVLMMDGFVVSHTKDAVLFEGDEEDVVERYLIEHTRDYRDFALKRRSGQRQGWSKEKIRDLITSMRDEFTSKELKDALETSALPPLTTILVNNQQLLKSLTPEDELGRFEVSSELTVIVSIKETSEWEPYVTIVAGAQAGTLYVIINGLHPYYESLESNDAIDECMHQYIYDAVAEYRASKLQGRVYPDSVRRIKNDLLRVRTVRLENALRDVQSKEERALCRPAEHRSSGDGGCQG